MDLREKYLIETIQPNQKIRADDNQYHGMNEYMNGRFLMNAIYSCP